MRVRPVYPFDRALLALERDDRPLHLGLVARFRPPASRSRRDPLERFHAELARSAAGWDGLALSIRPGPLGCGQVLARDPDFEVERHLNRAPGPLPGLIDGAMAIPLRRDRPPWEAWYCEEREGERVGLVFKGHRCLFAGVTVEELGRRLFGRERGPAERGTLPTFGRALGVARGTVEVGLEVAGGAAEALRTPAATLRAARRGLMAAARRERLGEADGVQTRRTALLAWELEEVDRAARRLALGREELVLAALAGGLGDHLLRAATQLHPVSTAFVSCQGERQLITPTPLVELVELPCQCRHPGHRAASLRGAVGGAGRSGQAARAALAVCGLGPVGIGPAVVGELIRRPAELVVVWVELEGGSLGRFALDELHLLVPLLPGHALSVGVVVVGRRLCLSLHGDREAVGELNLLGRAATQAFNELCDVGQRVAGRNARVALAV